MKDFLWGEERVGGKDDEVRIERAKEGKKKITAYITSVEGRKRRETEKFEEK